MQKTYTIKKLEWESKDETCLIAENSFALYVVYSNAGGCTYSINPHGGKGYINKDTTDLESAKEQCEIHYRNRLLQSLEEVGGGE